MAAVSTARDALLAELDKALIESDTRWDAIREAENDLHRMKTGVVEFDKTAQQLRIALFAIDGKDFTSRSLGEANGANNARKIELRRGQS